MVGTKLTLMEKQALLVVNLYQKWYKQFKCKYNRWKNKVTADVLRVRTAPNTSSSVSGRVYEGQTLNVIGQENGWVKSIIMDKLAM